MVPHLQWCRCLIAPLKLDLIQKQSCTPRRPPSPAKEHAQYTQGRLTSSSTDLREEYCTDHGTATANADGVPTHMILCPPPSILVTDGMGYVHHRKILRVGTCPFCMGKHDKIKDCVYAGRCRACLKALATLKHKGNKHCCGLGVPGLPRDTPSSQKVKPNVIVQSLTLTPKELILNNLYNYHNPGATHVSRSIINFIINQVGFSSFHRVCMRVCTNIAAFLLFVLFLFF